MQRTSATNAKGLKLAAFALALWVTPWGAHAQQDAPRQERQDNVPTALEKVGIEEHLGRQMPLDLPFVTSDGRAIKLHEIIRGTRPILLTLNYADCPMLCNLQLDGLVDALRQVSLVPGKDFDLITVSINPNEQLSRTQAFKDKYLAAYDKPEALLGWHFLKGDQDAISRVAQATGFLYTYVPSQKEYAHTAAFMLLSPEGMITRYMYGVMFEPRDLRLALVEAAEGKTGTTLDRILLYCFHFDAATGRYAPMAQNIMRLGGFITMSLLGLALGIFWRRELRDRVVAIARK
jgi:protein SCO1/2